MLKNSVLKRGIITTSYPKKPFVPYDCTRGFPLIDMMKCTQCRDCARSCPVTAIDVMNDHVIIDAGMCIFCEACERACNAGAIKTGHDLEIAFRRKKDLKVTY